MIGFLKGTIVQISPETCLLIIDVQGTGYEVGYPKRYCEKLSIGQSVALWIYTHVREDALLLFGFLSETEKKVFKLLLSCSGLGPKTSMQIVGELAPQDLVQAITKKDIFLLSSVPGVGKKTAERIALELASKCQSLLLQDHVETPTGLKHDLQLALEHFGFPQSYSRAVVERVLVQYPGESLEILIRKALAILTQQKMGASVYG